jgi:ABC-type Na+ transport system ATPase subunit NatA
MSEPGVEVHGLQKAFGEVQALAGLSLAVTAGSVVAVMTGVGGPAAHDVLISLAWSGGMLIVFAILAVRSYARMGR